MRKHTYAIIIPADSKPRPKIHEETAAAILAQYFETNVYFIANKASRRTPDLRIGVDRWEVKSIQGASSNTIKNNMRKAATQSANIVIDLRRTKLHQTRAVGYVKYFLKYENAARQIKKVIVITRAEKVLVVK